MTTLLARKCDCGYYQFQPESWGPSSKTNKWSGGSQLDRLWPQRHAEVVEGVPRKQLHRLPRTPALAHDRAPVVVALVVRIENQEAHVTGGLVPLDAEQRVGELTAACS